MTKFKRAVATVLLPSVVLYASGCSLVASGTQRLSVGSEPDGAQVVINGELAGSTPLETSINRRHEATIIIRKDGYSPVTKTTSRSLSTIGIVDVVFGCLWLVPLLGLIGDGAYDQDPDNISVILPKA